jgi:hypothetical protein
MRHSSVLLNTFFVLGVSGVLILMFAFGETAYAINYKDCAAPGAGTSLQDVPPHPIPYNSAQNGNTALGCACNYNFSITVTPDSLGTYTIKCDPASDFVCSKNNYSPKEDVKINDIAASDLEKADMFCLKRVGTGCSIDADCEADTKCVSGVCKKDIGQKSVEGLFGREVTDVRDTIRRFLNIGLGFLGVVVVIFVIYGGFLWLTAGGSDDRVTKGKHTLVWASIGAVIIAIAWSISSYVFKIGAQVST